MQWILTALALRLHDQQITSFGGSHGIRDQGLFESALARPQNVYAYEPDADVARLAAAYAFGISSNHCFIDGNKRTALMVSFLFVEKNGYQMTASETDAYQTFMKLAAGEMTEDDLAEWFRANIREE